MAQIYMSRNSRVFTTNMSKEEFAAAIYMSRNSRVFTTRNTQHEDALRSTWVEIHVCLQRKTRVIFVSLWSTWVEIHVCLQHGSTSYS